ncbi:hypothetical protein LOC54_06150 [Acetobacter sp. AN02]|uniref:hypothetical protein n=1 Tax=Acetobacter sp. AN02 TaxID=2894186 RepID=UPI002434441D|nr:hypothetical protein [Acetobacter sp. AN02]MDG6094692.1 hypothetical protein [Acetobacter sp. AN02]
MHTNQPHDALDRDALLFTMLLPALIRYRDSLDRDVPEITAAIALLRIMDARRE